MTSQLSNTNSQQINEIQSLKSQLAEKDFEIDTLTNEINDQKQEQEFQSAENQNLKQELANLTKELANQQSQIDALASSGEQDRENMKTMTSELESKEDEIGCLHQKISDLENEYESKVKEQLSEQKTNFKKIMESKTKDM